MKRIVEKFKDPSGKWCVRAEASAGESVFLWFDAEPTQREVTDAVVEQLRVRAAEPVREEPVRVSRQLRLALRAVGINKTDANFDTAFDIAQTL